MQTLKYNPKDLKGLRKILPKSNYDDEGKQAKKLDLDEGASDDKIRNEEVHIRQRSKTIIIPVEEEEALRRITSKEDEADGRPEE